MRSDEKTEVDWVIASFDTSGKPPKLQLKKTGKDASKFGENLDEDTFNFGLIRLNEVIDQSNVVKFCYVKSQPEKTKMMVKAKLGLLGGGKCIAFVRGTLRGLQTLNTT